MTNLLFQKRDGDLAVEVSKDKNGHRRIEFLRQYEKNGEWHVTNHLGYENHRRGAELLKAAKDWIKAEEKKEGEKREAERQAKAPKDWAQGLRYGQRRLLKAAERGR